MNFDLKIKSQNLDFDLKIKSQNPVSRNSRTRSFLESQRDSVKKAQGCDEGATLGGEAGSHNPEGVAVSGK